MTLPCGCLASTRVVDQARHDAFHALAVEQGLPPGPVNAKTCQEARGLGGDVGMAKVKRR